MASNWVPPCHVYIRLRRTCRPPCCTSSAGRIAHHLRKTLAHLWYSERGCARTSLASLSKDNLARRKCKAPQASLLRGLFLGMMRLLIPFMSELEGSRAFQALLVETSQPEPFQIPASSFVPPARRLHCLLPTPLHVSSSFRPTKKWTTSWRRAALWYTSNWEHRFLLWLDHQS